MNQLVSVVIPTYNRPIYLKRTIESVLNQTYRPIEVIVVDDNNPNTEARAETERVMSEFANNGMVSYIQHETNKNGSAARNTGWRAAKGEYITFLDDDDEIDSTKLEKQIKLLESLSSEWGACYTAYHTLRPNGIVENSCENRSGDCYVYALMKTLFLGSGSNLLLRKSVVDEIHGYDASFRRSQDLEFLARVAEKYKIAFLNEDLLTVHWEEGRRKTYKEVKGYCDYYLSVFMPRINLLSAKDKERVLTVITLDQSKIALAYHEYGEAMKLLKENRIKLRYIVKYICYIGKRILLRKSFGFYI